MKIYLFIVLLVGVGYGQLDSGDVNIEQLVSNELKKDIKQPSIFKLIQRSCCGGCVFGLLGFSTMPEFGFWGILFGSIIPNIALIKKEQRLVKRKSVHPNSFASNEQKEQYLKTYEEEKKRITNITRNKSCIIGAIAFFTAMHVLMNTDVYFAWFPTAG